MQLRDDGLDVIALVLVNFQPLLETVDEATTDVFSWYVTQVSKRLKYGLLFCLEE